MKYSLFSHYPLEPMMHIWACSSFSKTCNTSSLFGIASRNKVKNLKLQTLRKDFETMEMKNTKSVDQFMMQTMNVVNKLSTHGEGVIDENVCGKVLKILPPMFDMVVTTIKERNNLA